MSSAILLYIKLENSGINKMPDCKHLTQKIKLCLNGGAYTYKRHDRLYGRMMRTIAYQVDVSGDEYKM